MTLTNQFHKYKAALLSLPLNKALTKEDLLVEPFLMERYGKLEMYYAPHNEYVNRTAKVVIIGLTPGWSQMKMAFQVARSGLDQGLADAEISKIAKEAASFVGSMRSNLVFMLDQLELPQLLGIATSEELFQKQRHLLHTTSLLRYPVFKDMQNYTGSTPNLVNLPYLWETAYLSIQEELEGLEQALIIPLGKIVEVVLSRLVGEGKLTAQHCLWGFPHPSGANGHRHSQFNSNSNEMKRIVRELMLR